MRYLNPVRIFLAFLILTAASQATAQNTDHRLTPTGWTTQFGGSGNDDARDVVVADDGSAYVVGVMERRSRKRAYISRFTADGRLIWTRYIQGQQGARALHAEIDRTRGRLLVTGILDGIHSGRRGRTSIQTLFVASYTARGEQIFLRTFDEPGNHSTRINPTDVAVGKRGHLYVVGQTEGNFAGNRRRSVKGTDLFIVKLDRYGRTVFSKLLGAANGPHGRKAKEIAHTVAIASNGMIHVSGHTDGDLLTGRRARSRRQFELTVRPDGRIANVTYRNKSNHQLDRVFDTRGNQFVVGTVARSRGLILRKLDRQGREVWRRKLGRNTKAGQLTLGKRGMVFAATATRGRSDLLLQAFSRKGRAVFSRRIGSRRDDRLGGIAFAPQQNSVLVVGRTLDRRRRTDGLVLAEQVRPRVARVQREVPRTRTAAWRPSAPPPVRLADCD